MNKPGTKKLRTKNKPAATPVTTVAAGASSTPPVMRAIENIESLIACGKLVPGQRLVEADLSEEMGIARGRVREALRILSGSGIVELIPFKGARVKRLGQDEVSALFRTITGLYCTALVSLTFVFPRLSAADRRKFQLASKTLTQAAKKERLDKLIQANNDYLAETNRLCENPHIAQLMSELHMAIFYKHYTEIVPETLFRNSMAMAEQVYETVVLGNPKKTIAVAWESVEPIIEHMMSLPDPVVAKPKRSSRAG